MDEKKRFAQRERTKVEQAEKLRKRFAQYGKTSQKTKWAGWRTLTTCGLIVLAWWAVKLLK